MKLIETLRDGEKVGGVYLCKHRQTATSKTGKEYENVTLQDRSGTIDCKIWEPNSTGIEEFGPLDYIYVVGEITTFQNNLQMNIKRVRVARSDEYRQEDYLPVSEQDTGAMYRELKDILGTVKNQWLRALIDHYFNDPGFEEAFCRHSAAKTIHHSFVGGLCEHTLSVVKMCEFFTVRYPYLNHDLLITAAAFHDVGKLREISNFPANDYTDDGQLLGHIVMGSELIGSACRRIPGFPHRLLSELQHCILAHHGEYEYGSPKKPALAEAMALNLADNADARLETMKEILASASKTHSPEEWLGFNRLMDSNLRKTGEW